MNTLDFCILEQSGKPSSYIVHMRYTVYEKLMQLIEENTNIRLFKRFENYFKDKTIFIGELNAFLLEALNIMEIIDNKENECIVFFEEMIALINKAKELKLPIEVIAD
jgi:hypothetical protein